MLLVNAAKQYLNICLKAFLFPHSPEYLAALLITILEFWIEFIWWPNLKRGFGLVAWVGVFLIIVGEGIRSLAHWMLGLNFSCRIKVAKEEGHELVTSGLYSILRHPSYTGFCWWYIGGQLLLFNPISLVPFCFIVSTYLKRRIYIEERLLVEFFPEKYPEYRARTAVLIPFCF